MHELTQQWSPADALTVLDTAVDSIITIDSQGIIQFVNRATLALFGYAESELIGQPIALLMPEPYRSRHQAFVDHYLNTGDAQIIGIGRELTAVSKHGREFPIYLAISEISTNEHRFFAGIIRDLSEQKEAQSALLEQRDRLAHVGRLSTMGEMTASIAHEINQPLTAIAMYAQASMKMLEQENFDREKLLNALDKLTKQSLRAGAVIERIQRFVRNEGGSREGCNLNPLLVDLRELTAGDAGLHSVTLKLDLDPDLPNVFCDPIQVQQVALNLIRNAIDAMSEIDCKNGNEVTIASALVNEGGDQRARDAYVEVTVTDGGPGVAKDQEDLVFSAFHTTKKDGMGMGLSICRSIIEAHGGTLDFRNNPDYGCTFYFRIPIGIDDE